VKVADRVFVVTGGGNGMGRELALGLLARGAKVAAVDIRQESLDETAELADVGDRLATFVVDVTDRERVGALPDQVIAAHGQVDGLINNAGIIQPFIRVNDLDYETIDRVINVNLYGQIHMIKAFLPHLLERPAAHIANVSSMGGFLPVPGQTMYGASKAAVKLLTEGLYAELLETNVGVSVIMPGAVTTGIADNSGVPMPDMSPEDIEKASSRSTTATEAARIMLDGIESDQLHIYVGKDSMMMGIANRAAPRMATHMIARQMKGLLSG
jgi:NAD(P)-dependent dehydrogenase (short-subunit alcohol dehydrogenase family)